MFIWYLSFYKKIGRKYIVGDEIITIPTQAINTFLMWSTEPYSERKSLDEKVLQMLLISCVPPPELALGRIKESTMMFIEGFNNLQLVFKFILSML